MIKSIAFTCYPTKDMTKARHFYETMLGLKPASNFEGKFQEYELGDGVFTLGLVGDCDGMPEFFKTRGTSIAFEVDNLDAIFDKMKSLNIPIEVEPIDTPVCRNVVGLHQLKSAS
jgi:catechol 2,3-dioxygenase-like lactoylglutathione lyase family enzyme